MGHRLLFNPKNQMNAIKWLRKLPILFIGFLFVPGPMMLTATAIVAVRADNVVIIGADSRATVENLGTKTFRSFCKIRSVGKYFYSASGYNSSSFTGFDIHGIIKDTFRSCSLKQNVASFDLAVVKPLANALEYERINNPQFFEEFNQKDKDRSALQIVFIGMDANILVVYSRDYVIEKDDPVSVKVSNEITSDSGIRDFLLGEKEPMLLAANENKELIEPPFNDEKIIKYIDTLITRAIKDKPEKVAGPIDILLIFKSNPLTIKWIQKKPECQP